MWVRVRGGAHDMYINQWTVLPPTVPQNSPLDFATFHIIFFFLFLFLILNFALR